MLKMPCLVTDVNTKELCHSSTATKRYLISRTNKLVVNFTASNMNDALNVSD